MLGTSFPRFVKWELQSTFAVLAINKASVATEHTVSVIPVSPSKKNEALKNTR